MSSLRPTREILRLLSCRPWDIDSSVIYFPSSEPVTLKALGSRPSSRGLLNTLPTELLTTIFLSLDFGSLASMRLTCVNLNQAIFSLREFQLVTKYASSVLRALKATNFERYYSISETFRALISPNCVLCGNFGPYFSILKGERVCYPCVFAESSLRLLFRSVAERYFGIPSANTSLREFRTPVLTNPENGSEFQKERVYVSFEEAKEEAVKNHGSEQKMYEFVFEVQSKDHETRGPNRDYSLRSRERDEDEILWKRGRNLVLGDLQWIEDFPRDIAFRGVTPFPWLDEKKGWTEDGVWCRGCVNDAKDRNMRERTRLRMSRNRTVEDLKVVKRAWREADLVLHVKGCKKAQRIWRKRSMNEGELSYIV